MMIIGSGYFFKIKGPLNTDTRVTVNMRKVDINKIGYLQFNFFSCSTRMLFVCLLIVCLLLI